MSMKPYSYVVAGIKTTREECEADGVDLYEQFEQNEHGIQAIYGEDIDDVLIGQVLFKTDPYKDVDHAVELTIPDRAWIAFNLAASGIADAGTDKIKLYAITVWL